MGALNRAISVFEAVVAEGSETSLAAIAVDTGLPKSTIHRILAIWVNRGYLVMTARGRYGPGPQLLGVAGFATATLDYARLARPYLRRLQSATEETIHLAMLIGNTPIYVDKLEGNRPYRMTSTVGMSLAFHSTAIGKAILGHMMKCDQEALLAHATLSQSTPRTIVSRADLAQELIRIRQLGYAIDDEENEDGVRCVGAPIFNYRSNVVGAVSISAPAVSFSAVDAESLAPAICETTVAISRELGATASIPAPRGGRDPLATPSHPDISAH